MPIYEYRCPNGHTFEVFQRMADAPIAVCEVCGAGPVEKLLFPVAVHFKGKGFYATDYGRAASRGGASKDGESGSAGKESSKDSKESSAGDKSSGGGDSGGGKTSSSDGGTSTSSKSD